MDISTVSKLPVYMEQKFRLASSLERRVGLWVDRVGGSRREREQDAYPPRRLRVFGQYCATAILAGQGVFVSQTLGSAPVEAGDVILLFPDEPAAYSGRAGFEMRWIAWNGEDAMRLEACGYLRRERPVVKDPAGAARRAYDALEPLMDREDMGAVLARKTVVLSLVHDLFAAAQRRRRPTDRRMQAAVDEIIERCAEPLTVRELADRRNLSVTHFRRLFKEYAGRGPKQFILAQRVARAKALLAKGLPLKQVAREVGFADVFYFMRTFRRLTGLTAARFAAQASS